MTIAFLLLFAYLADWITAVTAFWLFLAALPLQIAIILGIFFLFLKYRV